LSISLSLAHFGRPEQHDSVHLRWASQGDISTLDPHANNESFNSNQVYEFLTQRAWLNRPRASRG
jgi:hypothetical protein